MGYSFVQILRHRSANLAGTYALKCVFASKGGHVTGHNLTKVPKEPFERCRYVLCRYLSFAIVRRQGGQ
ncbi:hypothetical protein D1823_03125 [Ruegeria sp. AD91A]|nr:hypothetical protein D1823_03125 [Ruegeria sp. AD91A]